MKSRIEKPWIVLACTSGLAASSIGINLNTVGLFYTPVSEDLGFYRGNFAMHTTILTLMMSITALFIPRLLTKVRFKWTIWFGVSLSVIATVMMAFATSLLEFYFLGAIRGIASSFYSMVPLTILINNWFKRKNGFAMSLGFGSSGLAGALLAPILDYVIQAFNWQTGFFVMAFFNALLCLPACLLSFSISPEEDGEEPYGGCKENTLKSKKESNPQINHQNKKSASILNFNFIALSILAIIHAAITGLAHHFPGYSETIGFSTGIGAWMLSAAMMGNITFKLLSGLLGDWLGAIRSALVVLTINILAILSMSSLHHPIALIGSGFLFGSINCVPIIVLPMLTIRFFGKSQYMKVYPIISFMAGIGGAFGVSLIGYIFDFTDSYFPAFYV